VRGDKAINSEVFVGAGGGGGGIRWSVQGALDHSGEAANAKRSRRTRV
jgi:hypothetical protein